MNTETVNISGREYSGEQSSQEFTITRFLLQQDSRTTNKPGKLNKCTHRQRNGAKGRRTSSYWESATYFQNKKRHHKKRYDTFRRAEEPTEEELAEYKLVAATEYKPVAIEEIQQAVQDDDFAQWLLLHIYDAAESLAATSAPDDDEYFFECSFAYNMSVDYYDEAADRYAPYADSGDDESHYGYDEDEWPTMSKWWW